jgi:hypothetical protein
MGMLFVHVKSLIYVAVGLAHVLPLQTEARMIGLANPGSSMTLFFPSLLAPSLFLQTALVAPGSLARPRRLSESRKMRARCSRSFSGPRMRR